MPARDTQEYRAARAARQRLRNRKASDTAGIRADIAVVYGKPLEEWTPEELARMRPDGFPDRPVPPWLAAVIDPELSKLIKNSARLRMSQHLPDAVRVLHEIATSTAVDDSGRPVVDPKTRVDAAKFIVDHGLGKERRSPWRSTPVRAFASCWQT